MASIDDVMRETTMLLDALVRTAPDGMTGGMGQVGSFPGLVPRTYRAVQLSHQASADILAVVRQTSALLNAINEETLGRIEARANSSEEALGRLETAVAAGGAAGDQSRARIESGLEQVLSFLPTVREDLGDLRTKVDAVSSELQQTTSNLSAKLDTLASELKQDMIDLGAKLDLLRADIKALPH
jgi:chromosome segregation ATPase